MIVVASLRLTRSTVAAQFMFLTLLLSTLLTLPHMAADTPSSDRVIVLRLVAMLHTIPELQGTTLSIDVRHGHATVTGTMSHPNAEAALRAATLTLPGLQHLRLEAKSPPLATYATRMNRIVVTLPLLRFADNRVSAASTTMTMKPTTPSPHAAILEVLNADARFAELKFTFNQGVVVLSGHAEQYEDVIACKQKLRHIPGIERIREANIDAR